MVSNTPTKTLFREWKYNNIISKVLLIGGQETGTKSQMIESATKYKYHNNKILSNRRFICRFKCMLTIIMSFFIQLFHQRKKNRGIFLNRGIKDFFNLDYKEKIEKIKINEFKAIFFW